MAAVFKRYFILSTHQKAFATGFAVEMVKEFDFFAKKILPKWEISVIQVK